MALMDETTSYSSLLSQLYHRAESANILVIGDLMLDIYQWGRVDRISPEAPVPVVDVERQEIRLGGAANVARNLYQLGATPHMCGVVGEDTAGEQMISLARSSHFPTDLIFQTSHRRTTVKERIIAHQQQMLRIDKEDRFSLTKEEKAQVLVGLKERIASFDAIIFEDYDKSMIDAELIQVVMNLAHQLSIPVMVDPKFLHFWNYNGATVFKPNLKELNEGLNVRLKNDQFNDIVEAILELRKRMPHYQTLVTLSSQGMLFVDEEGQSQHIKAHYRNIADVSGAGDTVISVLTLGWIAGLTLSQAVTIANLAGGIVCEEVGVVPISKAKLEKEIPKLPLINHL